MKHRMKENPFIVRHDNQFRRCYKAKLSLTQTVGLITQYEYKRRDGPCFNTACTSWNVSKKGIPVSMGITLGNLKEWDVATIIEHEVLHEVIGYIENVKSGWEFDNCIYADFQRQRLRMEPQVYRNWSISLFFYGW